MKRGEVWWAELQGDAGFRPVLVVTRSEGLEWRRNVTIAEVTRAIRSIPSEVQLSRSDGMPHGCVANTDNLHTIPKDRFRQRITSLTGERMFALNRALHYALDLDE